MKIGKLKLSCVIPQTLVSNVTSLHKFLYGEEDYKPSSTVQTISNKIAELTGLNKAGKEIDHVATDQGYIPKGETEATTLSAEEESKQESQEESQMESMLEESKKESESTRVKLRQDRTASRSKLHQELITAAICMRRKRMPTAM